MGCGVSIFCGQCYVGEVACLRSVILTDVSGMLGQHYVESMVREVSEWCMRSAVCCVSGVGSMVCMVS